MPDLSALFNLPPERASAYLKAKGLKLTGPYWELDGPAHSRVFTVANLAKLDVLADIKDAVQGAIDSGQTERWFADRLKSVLQAKGWWGPTVAVDPVTGEARMMQQGSLRRLQTIYRTNLQTAYMAGRHAQALEQADRAPFAQYLAVRDSRSRPAHAALHGKVFRLDSPEWSIVSPPNGYNCRCRARYMSQRELDKRGLKVEGDTRLLERTPQRPPADPLTGESPERIVERGVSVPSRTKPGERDVLWADRGWDHLPGSDGAERALVDRVLAQAQQAGAPLGAAAAAPVLALNLVREALTAGFSAWADGIVHPRGQVKVVGSLSPTVVQRLDDLGIQPQSATLAVRDEDVLHTHRDTKADALPWTWYRELPRYLAAPKAVLLDRTDPKGALLMVFDIAGETGKLVVKIDYAITLRGADGIKRPALANIVRSGKTVPPEALADRTAYQVLDGSL